MDGSTPLPAPTLLPDTAPFTPEQRAYLSGLVTALLTVPASAAPAVAPEIASSAASNDDAPWHDPAMALDERQKLAEDRPIAPRLMAAMAQQDCGQCGYTCAAYANALAQGAEERLNLCSPGGKETLRALKVLAAERAPVAEGTAPAPVSNRAEAKPAAFVSRRKLNSDASEKDTFHIEFDLAGTGLDYVVGDSLGVMPRNPPSLVDAIITQLGGRPEGIIRGKALRDLLIEDLSLSPAPDALFELIGYVTGGERRAKARALAEGGDPDGDAATLDVLATLHKFYGVRMDAEAFVETLDPLQPRLYSISSSPRTDPGRVTLTVDMVRYKIGQRTRLGVASTYLAQRIETGGAVPVYVQKAHGFALPETLMTPIIMVGPGTGIAPFRAFLQERQAVQAPGKNWLFFGHQRSDCDFFYQEEFSTMTRTGLLTRLSLAWSRDAGEKIYVQDKMRESGEELWRWLEDGAHFYVCGDAKRMARDVERAMVDIVAKHGKRTPEEALAYVHALKAANRYQADVY